MVFMENGSFDIIFIFAGVFGYYNIYNLGDGKSWLGNEFIDVSKA